MTTRKTGSGNFVFLDRDGVINVERGDYTKTVEEWEWAPGAFEGIRKLTRAGFSIIVITNQSCISRGILTEAELRKLHDYMIDTIHEAGGEIFAVYHCPHQLTDNCSCRKPEPGMLLRAGEEYGIDLSKTFFIGDAPRDMEAGRRAGTLTIYIENELYADQQKQMPPPDFRAENLFDAAGIVLRETGIEV